MKDRLGVFWRHGLFPVYGMESTNCEGLFHQNFLNWVGKGLLGNALSRPLIDLLITAEIEASVSRVVIVVQLDESDQIW